MSHLFAGTSGFAYPTWKPGFYPADIPSPRFLSYYASKLNTTEVNYTFRRLPSAKTLEAWVNGTPDGFVFTCKAHMKLTHSLRLRGTDDFLPVFLRALAPLGTRLGPILFQLPPQVKADASVLDDFLRGVPGNIRAAFEFRHASWFSGAVYAVLQSHQAALCLAESEDLETPEVHTAPWTYLRLRKSPYTPEQRDNIAARVDRYLGRGDVYAYFKHEESPAGALDAMDLLARPRSFRTQG